MRKGCGCKLFMIMFGLLLVLFLIGGKSVLAVDKVSVICEATVNAVRVGGYPVGAHSSFNANQGDYIIITVQSKSPTDTYLSWTGQCDVIGLTATDVVSQGSIPLDLTPGTYYCTLEATALGYLSSVYVFEVIVRSSDTTPTEICDNDADDDGDGLVDCVDLDCADNPACSVDPGSSPLVAVAKAQNLLGLTEYSDELSARPGDFIRFSALEGSTIGLDVGYSWSFVPDMNFTNADIKYIYSGTTYPNTQLFTVKIPDSAVAGTYMGTLNLIRGSDFASNDITLTVLAPPIDSDGDGLSDEWELTYFGSLTYNGTDDPDFDGLNNGDEFKYATNPMLPDTDYDGMDDHNEILYNCADPSVKLDPTNPDSDGDGLKDGWEASYYYYYTKLSATLRSRLKGYVDPCVITSANADFDGDGYRNSEEEKYYFNPVNPYTAPVAILNVTPNAGDPPLKVEFDVKGSYAVDPYSRIASYVLVYDYNYIFPAGNGTVIVTPDGVNYSSGEQIELPIVDLAKKPSPSPLGAAYPSISDVARYRNTLASIIKSLPAETYVTIVPGSPLQVTHEYSTPGKKTAVLIVTGAAGENDVPGKVMGIAAVDIIVGGVTTTTTTTGGEDFTDSDADGIPDSEEAAGCVYDPTPSCGASSDDYETTKSESDTPWTLIIIILIALAIAATLFVLYRQDKLGGIGEKIKGLFKKEEAPEEAYPFERY